MCYADPEADKQAASDYQRYSVKFDLEDEDEDPVEKQPWGVKDYLKLAAVIVGLALLACLLYRALGPRFFKFVLHTLHSLVKDNSFFSYLVLVLCRFVFAGVLFFPGLSTFNILQAFLMKSFFKSFVISVVGIWLASVVVVFVIKRFFRQQIIERFRQKILFRIVYIEVKKNPWRFGLIFNMLMIPVSVKNYLMALTSISMFQYAIVILPANIIYSMMFSFVGTTMTDLSEISADKPFSQKSTAEKVQAVFTYVVLAATIGLFVMFFIVAKRKYEEIENQHRMESAIARNQIMEMERGRKTDKGNQ